MLGKYFTVFDYQFDNPEIENAFEEFIEYNGLSPLFTDEHRANPIKVGLTHARSVVNIAEEYEYHYTDKRNNKQYTRIRQRKEGASRKPLLEMADILLTATDNQQYKDIMFFFIDKPTDFNGFMAMLKNALAYINGKIDDKHQYNKWNIVWYNRYDLK